VTDDTSTQGTVQIDRHARVFTAGADRTRELAAAASVHRLMTGQVFTPEAPCDLVMRHGSLRVREQLPDGRRVTRAVLQTGAVCRLRTGDSVADDSPLYSLETMNFVALGEAEVWQLIPGAC